MPIYEYGCSECGHRFEVMQKFSDAPLTECPKCKGEVKKLISNTSFVLKGSGWYADGYASAGVKSDSKAEKSKGAKSSSGKSKTDTAKKFGS